MKKSGLTFVIILIFSISLVPFVEAPAYWTRAYCLYNAGSGGYACDSGQVAGDSASCSASESTKCAEQGAVYCYAQSNCEIGGTTTSSPTNAYTVNWDGSQTSCTCKVGSGKWSIGGEIAATSCCGNDANEYKITRVGGTDAPTGFTTDASDDACCNANNKCSQSSTCYASGSTAGAIPTKAYCNAGGWEGGDAGTAQCTAIIGAGYWSIGGETAATNCCGDDSGENKKTRICSSGCTSDSNDDACCDVATDCSYGGSCYASGSNICLGNLVLNCNSGTWAQSQNCDASDGWYNYGDIGLGCNQMNDPTAEQRDYSCSAGSCNYSITQSKDCDASDGWYGGGDTAGCGADTSSQQRDYYVDSTGNCVYTTTNCPTKNCDSSDICSNTCDGTTLKTYKDYYVTANTNQCAFTFGSAVEECTTKNSYESDGGINYLISGYVLDYTSCSGNNCSGATYTDTCNVDTLTEYYASGTSYSSTQKNCNDYDNTTCLCTVGSSLNEVCDNWNCGSGKCQDSGSDWTRNTWVSDGLCTQQSCQGTTYRNYHTNAGSNIWGISAEATETACNDGYDNNCNGEWDYDTLDRGPGGNVPPHGDSNCAISITAISLFTQQKCPGGAVEVECTSSVANVNSIDAVLDANGDGIYAESEKCNFIAWNGNKANFTCNVGTSLGIKNVNCSVNTAKSYKSGTDKITTITVGGTSCCSGYGAQGNCEGDLACDWCPECSSTKYSGDVDRCVAAGTCSYYCWKGKCGATCDGTQGGCIGAQTCEANCSCSSGSCNPDLDKLCCDNDIGYLPNKNVSQSIFNFDNMCPPTETCFDLSWLFEAGNASCCGDDPNEFWKIMNCSSGCMNNLTDEACCNNANDCVYSGACYSNMSCYSSGLYCNSGKWYDNDDNKLYCDTCGSTGLWNIGGDLANCCNDSGEYKLTERGATDGTDSDACCNANNKCVDDDNCFASATCHDTGSTASADEYCDAGIWKDNDDSQAYCDACVGNGKWALGGDTAQTSCCGDDANEFYAGPSNGKSCDGTSSACCNSSFKYSNGGQCVLSCSGGFAVGKWFFLGLGPEGSGESKLKFEISDNNNPSSIITDNELSHDTFHHIAVTFNNTNKEVKIFVDGRLEKVGTIDRNISLLNSLYYMVGHTNFSFNGTVDEFKVYNRILDEAEIRTRYEYNRQIIYSEIPKQNEARLVKAGAKEATAGDIAPIIKVGNKEKICDVTSTVDLPKCAT